LGVDGLGDGAELGHEYLYRIYPQII
jgi:hypothetical protein